MFFKNRRASHNPNLLNIYTIVFLLSIFELIFGIKTKKEAWRQVCRQAFWSLTLKSPQNMSLVRFLRLS